MCGKGGKQNRMIQNEYIHNNWDDLSHCKNDKHYFVNLDAHGVKLIVLEDFVYCDCEYTKISL